MRWTIDQLNPMLRAQAQRKLDLVRARSPNETQHVCKDDVPTANEQLRTNTHHRKRLNRPAQIPRMSDPEERLAFHLKAEGLGQFKREHRFHATRKWRFDFAFLLPKLAVEVDGLLRGDGGRHQRLIGYERDAVKQNEAILLGWRVLRFTPRQVKNGYAVRTIKRALANDICTAATNGKV